MDFEWDDAKHAINLGKHGLDFVDANLLFESAFLLEPARKVGAELRELAIGRIQDRLVALIFTRRGTASASSR